MAKATYVATPSMIPRLRTTRTSSSRRRRAICGSDLHSMNGYMPTMETGDILGHESMGEVVEVGKAHSKFKVGDRVVVPFNLACGECFFCKKQLYSLATGRTAMRKRQSRPWASPRWVCSVILTCVAAKLWASGISSRALCDVGPIKVPDEIRDEHALVPLGHLSDRLCGHRERRNRGRRHRRHLGLRPSRPVRHLECVDARH